MIKHYNFHKLISEHIIEIPIIQRDYAQGRELPNVNYIREKFVSNLVETLVNNKGMHLGFVYGKIEGKDKLKNMLMHKETVEKLIYTVEQYANQFDIEIETSIQAKSIELSNTLRFIPLDGQQRLTTLFLLYWYINMRKLGINSSWLTNFKYNNRKAALAFFEEIGIDKNLLKIQLELDINIKNQLQNYTWFLGKWNYDATVSGALVMLQQIHDEFKKYQDFRFEDVVIEELDFTFDFLDLDELSQSDELYIKMNERGKQLTDFEHFKAWLQEHLSNHEDYVKNKDFLNDFWKKLDTEWLDLFWKNCDVDFTGLDDFYFNFLKTMAINYHLANYPEKELPSYLKSLLQDIRNTDSYEKNKVKYIPLSKFVQRVKSENGEECNFELFSFDALKFIKDSFELLNQLEINSELKLGLKRVFDKPFINNSISDFYFKKEKNFTLNLWDHTIYFSLIKYFQKTKHFNDAHFSDWFRILRNLVFNTYIQSPENLYSALHSLNDLFEKHFSNDTLSNVILNDDFDLTYFYTNQLKEEKIKAKLFKKDEWQQYINRFEKHNYFYGQIEFILNLSKDDNLEYDLNKFIEKGEVLEKLFERDTKEFLLQRALLTKGDYLLRVGSNYSFCKTETDSLRNRNENWRKVFNSDKGLKFINSLVQDILNKDGQDIYLKLTDVIDNHKYTNNQWEYYFIESSYPLEWCKIFEIRWNKRGDDVRLLQSKTVIGYHLELRTIYLLKYINSKISNLNPFNKIEFLWDKTADGHPGISLVNCIVGNKTYQLDIRYTFENNEYLFCFYHKANSINDRNVPIEIEQYLVNFNFDEKYRHYFKIVSFENIIDELGIILNNLKNA